MDIAQHRSALAYELKRQGGGIDIKNLSPELRRAIAETGLDAEKLTRIAGRNGYDAQGRLCCDFKDLGDKGKTGRSYVDGETGKLFREGDGESSLVHSSDYQVSQVRTYAGVK
jgi:hypothetical protein